MRGTNTLEATFRIVKPMFLGGESDASGTACDSAAPHVWQVWRDYVDNREAPFDFASRHCRRCEPT